MKNCAVCDTNLKFSNTPTFGSGKLHGGEVVCIKCFKQITNADPKIGFKLKKKTLDEIKFLLRATYGDVDKIRTQLESLRIDGVSNFFGRKEIKELPRILAENEDIDNIIQGTYNGGMGILVSTNRRLIFIDKGMIYGLKVEDFPLSKISSIQYETGLVMGKLKIHTSGNVAVIVNVDKNQVRKFSEFVRNKIESLAETEQPLSSLSKPDVYDKLEKLGKLRDSGILSQEEFESQKNILLKNI